MGKPVSCMDFLGNITGEERLKYASLGSDIADRSGLRAYMKESGIDQAHRSSLYVLIGAAMDESCPHSRECVFGLMKEGEHVIERAPRMREYLREILRPRWEKYHLTLMEGIDAAVSEGINDDLVGPDPGNPRVPDKERHDVYRVIGEIRTGQRDKNDVSEVFEIFSRHHIPVRVVMEMTHILEPCGKGDNEPEAVRGD